MNHDGSLTIKELRECAADYLTEHTVESAVAVHALTAALDMAEDYEVSINKALSIYAAVCRSEYGFEREGYNQALDDIFEALTEVNKSK